MLNATLIRGYPVQVEAHHTLKSSRGVMYCTLLDGLTVEDIKEHLSDEGVTAVHRVIKKVNN